MCMRGMGGRLATVIALAVLVVVTVLVVSAWRADDADARRVANQRKKLERAYVEGRETRASLEMHGQGGEAVTPGVCARYFDGTDASRIKGASEAFVRLARGYFVAGCMSGGAELAAVGG
jgi:hypothetical protein